MKHKVTYDTDGGSTDAPVQKDLEPGERFIVKSYAGTKEGFTFGGWSYGGRTYQPGDEMTMGDSDIILKAVWKGIQPEPSGDGGNSNTIMIVAIAAVVIVIIGTAAFFFIRKK